MDKLSSHLGFQSGQITGSRLNTILRKMDRAGKVRYETQGNEAELQLLELE